MELYFGAMQLIVVKFSNGKKKRVIKIVWSRTNSIL
jgi:hypothetical protein